MVSVTIMPLLMVGVLGTAYVTVGLCKPRPKHSMKKLRKKYVVPLPLKSVFPLVVAIEAFRRTFATYMTMISAVLLTHKNSQDYLRSWGTKLRRRP